jgi:tripartite-type tricarboxylate transporter receptor subunit TctC
MCAPLKSVIAGMLLACVAVAASAQHFPERPVRIILGFPPAGGVDLVARILASKLTEYLGQQVIVDNRPGASGLIGTEIAAKAAAGFEVANWYGMVVPAGTPRHAIARLNAELNRAMKLPEIAEKLIAQGTEPAGTSPEQFGAFIKAESVKWSGVIRDANIRAD